MLNEEQCWQAVLRRDRSQDGRFLTGVKTTGIFCRPSCPARKPLRKNVRFYRTAAEAERDGLRACLRCHPTRQTGDPRVTRMRELCELIRDHSDSGDPLPLEVLARHAGISPSRLKREFRDVVGITPRQYVEACRFEALKAGLKSGESVTRAIYDAGFGSSSRVYEQANARLGMTPSEYRAGGRDVAISYTVAEIALGRLLIAGTDRGLCFVALGDSADELVGELRREYPAAAIRERGSGGSKRNGSDRSGANGSDRPGADGSGQLDLWLDALERHLDGGEPHLELPVDVRATAFQQRVWKYLQTIPYGETRTYSEVASAIGSPAAVRAVGSACGANRAAIAIPCHRVIRTDGGLGGYRWGLERKRRLLAREQRSRQVAAADERRIG